MSGTVDLGVNAGGVIMEGVVKLDDGSMGDTFISGFKRWFLRDVTQKSVCLGEGFFRGGVRAPINPSAHGVVDSTQKKIFFS